MKQTQKLHATRKAAVIRKEAEKFKDGKGRKRKIAADAARAVNR